MLLLSTLQCVCLYLMSVSKCCASVTQRHYTSSLADRQARDRSFEDQGSRLRRKLKHNGNSPFSVASMAFKSRTAIILCVFLVLGASLALAASVSTPSVEGLKAQAKGQASGWELTLHRQKLRAQALADELGALIEQAARKVLGSHYTNVYSSWTSFRYRTAPFLSRARLHLNQAYAYLVHLSTQLEATILDLTGTHKTRLGASAEHLTNYASLIAKGIIAIGAIGILALLQRLRPGRSNAQRRRV